MNAHREGAVLTPDAVAESRASEESRASHGVSGQDGQVSSVEERGALKIDHVVVRKVAERVANHVPGTATMQRRIAGLEVGKHGAKITVSGRGNDVDLALELALHYPSPIPTVVSEVREKVIEEVARITSYRVRSVKITISALLPDVQPRVQ